MQSTNKKQTGMILIIIFILLCFGSFVCCCCLSIVGGGFSDWYMSECLATTNATNDEKTACYSHTSEQTCEADASGKCWYRHSIITLMMDSLSGSGN